VSTIKEDIESRDSIDFAGAPVGKLFRQLFVPALLGMVSMVVVNLADGAFVGHGAGGDSLAAINIAAPIFNLMTGIGIMFGIGSSIIASIHLSQGKKKAAELNLTQALIGSFIIALCLSILILTHLDATCRIFGSNETLLPLAHRYLRWIALFMPVCMIGLVGGFAIRLDGSPRYAMCCTLIAGVMNVILDWLFVFPLHMGLEGAAIATSISFSSSGVLALAYLLFFSKTLHLRRLKLSLKSLVLTCRNLWYQIKAGFSTMVGETSVAVTMIVGNFVFIKYLGEDGVAAYSVACYCMPIIIMVGNAIVESIQPIASFAYGVGDMKRAHAARRIGVISGIVTGIVATLIFSVGAPYITLVFMSPSDSAYQVCVNGLPWFSIGAIFIALNIVLIGYLQSIERAGAAVVFSLLRGFVIVLPAFLILPTILDVPGIWLSIPVAEILTFAGIIVYSSVSRRRA